jgi:hypothetical protein
MTDDEDAEASRTKRPTKEDKSSVSVALGATLWADAVCAMQICWLSAHLLLSG